jgi:hypothetical protein
MAAVHVSPSPKREPLKSVQTLHRLIFVLTQPQCQSSCGIGWHLQVCTSGMRLCQDRQDSRLGCQRMATPEEGSESRVDRGRQACFQHQNRWLPRLRDLPLIKPSFRQGEVIHLQDLGSCID